MIGVNWEFRKNNGGKIVILPNSDESLFPIPKCITRSPTPLPI